MNKFTATFASGIATRMEESTIGNVTDYVLHTYGSYSKFYDLGGVEVTMEPEAVEVEAAAEVVAEPVVEAEAANE